MLIITISDLIRSLKINYHRAVTLLLILVCPGLIISIITLLKLNIMQICKIDSPNVKERL